jgi:hypothetical protein
MHAGGEGAAPRLPPVWHSGGIMEPADDNARARQGMGRSSIDSTATLPATPSAQFGRMAAWISLHLPSARRWDARDGPEQSGTLKSFAHSNDMIDDSP